MPNDGSGREADIQREQVEFLVGPRSLSVHAAAKSLLSLHRLAGR